MKVARQPWPIPARRAGDQTANLWWQLRNGLLPRRNLPDAAVVMIGTNDLGFLDACSRWGADDLAAVPGIASRRAPPPAPARCAGAGARTVPFAARSLRWGLAGPGQPSWHTTCLSFPEVCSRWETATPLRCPAAPAGADRTRRPRADARVAAPLPPSAASEPRALRGRSWLRARAGRLTAKQGVAGTILLAPLTWLFSTEQLAPMHSPR